MYAEFCGVIEKENCFKWSQFVRQRISSSHPQFRIAMSSLKHKAGVRTIPLLHVLFIQVEETESTAKTGLKKIVSYLRNFLDVNKRPK